MKSTAEYSYIDGILPRGPYPPCLRMADRALFWQDTLDMLSVFDAVIPQAAW